MTAPRPEPAAEWTSEPWKVGDAFPIPSLADNGSWEVTVYANNAPEGDRAPCSIHGTTRALALAIAKRTAEDHNALAGVTDPAAYVRAVEGLRDPWLDLTDAIGSELDTGDCWCVEIQAMEGQEDMRCTDCTLSETYGSFIDALDVLRTASLLPPAQPIETDPRGREGGPGANREDG